MKRKFLPWIIAAFLMLCMFFLLIKISPRRIRLTLQDTTNGTVTELQIEGWTWNFFTHYSESLNFIWEPHIKATMTMTPHPNADNEES